MADTKSIYQYAAAMFKLGKYFIASRAYWKALLTEYSSDSCREEVTKHLVKCLMKCYTKGGVSFLLEEILSEENMDGDDKMIAEISTLTAAEIESYHHLLGDLRQVVIEEEHKLQFAYKSSRRLVIFQSGSNFITHKLPRFFSWVIPGYLAGLAIPNTAQDIFALKAMGVKLVVTLSAESPLPQEWFPHSYGVRNVFYGVPNGYPPTVEEVDAFFKEVDDLLSGEEMGKRPHAIAVHCGGGVGRAGTLLACYLVKHGATVARGICDGCRDIAQKLNRAVRSPNCRGESCANAQPPNMTANDAIELLRSGRPTSLENSWQEAFVKEYVSILWQRYQNPANPIGRHESTDNVAKPLSFSGKPVVPLFVMLVGLPGSGKSWFADQMEKEGGGNWIRVCQDVLKGREACERAVSTLGKAGKILILDRCNPSAKERKEFLELASKPVAVAVYFDADIETCKERIKSRFGHETIRAGGGGYALSSMAKAMEYPTFGEGYSAIYCVHNFDNARELVEKWSRAKGKKTNNGVCRDGEVQQQHVQQPVAVLQDVIKFPQTPHFFDPGGGVVTSDDIVADRDGAFNMLRRAGTSVHVEEKIDGGNLGFSLAPTHEIVVQNRTHYISFKEQKQYEYLGCWLPGHCQRIKHILGGKPGERILYGEWLVAMHSIRYMGLPDYFMAYDLLDVKEKKFYSRERFDIAINEANEIQVEEGKIFRVGRIVGVEWTSLNSEEKWKNVLKRESMYGDGDGDGEGIYIRIDEGEWLVERMKLVRSDFRAGNEHFSKHQIMKNHLAADV